MTGVGGAPERARRGVAHPLLSGAARSLAIALLAVCVAVAPLLGTRYTGQARAGWLDTTIDGRVQALVGEYETVLNLVIHLGDPVPVITMAAMLLLGCLVTRRWRGAVLVAVAVPVATVLTQILQPLIDRTMHGGVSFPSGHATGVFALAVTFTVLSINPPEPRLPAALRATLALAAIFTACVVAVALVALDFHYATDTVGGGAVATGVILLTALILDRLAGRDGNPDDPRRREPAG
jgi:membrane-associated phospholipid phosphatase